LISTSPSSASRTSVPGSAGPTVPKRGFWGTLKQLIALVSVIP